MKPLLYFLSIIAVFSLNAQTCNNCTTVLSANTSANLNVVQGETLCIESGVTVTGNLTISGGTVCNNGIINGDIGLYWGQLNNYGTITVTQNVTHLGGDLNNYGNITGGDYTAAGANSITNFGLLLTGNIDLSNEAIGPNLEVYNYGTMTGINMNVDSTVLSNSGTLYLSGNLIASYEGDITNMGTLSVGGNFLCANTCSLHTICTIDVQGDWSNGGIITGPSSGYGGFSISGIAQNLSSGQIALDGSNIDICENNVPGGLDNYGQIGPNVTQCQNSTNCTPNPSNGFIHVFNDLDQNCVVDNGEYGIEGVMLFLSPGNEIFTTSSGGYSFINGLPDGNYTLTVDTTNLNWAQTCSNSIDFTVSDGLYSQSLFFGFVSENPCASPDVSIFMPTMRTCTGDQLIYVMACNEVTATGILSDSYIEIQFPQYINPTSASLPYTDLGNGLFQFQTGDILPGECVYFNLNAFVSCSAPIGLTQCLEARLYPVSPCVLDSVPSTPITGNGTTTVFGTELNGFPVPCITPWDQSSLSVDGWCQNDSTYFTITNTGDPIDGDMECYSPLWITIDGVLTYSDSILIAGGETITLIFPGDGQTWQLNAAQHPLHPGNSNPNAVVEACGGDLTNWTPGGVDDLPADDADPINDIYCGQIMNGFDPNDKTVVPNGITEEHFVQPNQQMQYYIRFQNTGNDLAYNIVIRDTLDEDLNIFTVVPGVASHPYTFRIYGPRVLEWTFENINLPDSTSNEPESHGFVTFHVDQNYMLSAGTQITNSADIYFDFNDPVITNETWNTIYYGFPAVTETPILLTEDDLKILVYPNPAKETIHFVQEKKAAKTYTVYDLQGKMIESGNLNGTDTEIQIHKLTKGMYLLKLDAFSEPVRFMKE